VALSASALVIAFFGSVHVVTYLLVNSAINAVGHRFGKRAYAGVATNNQWLALFTWGEGLHSNHHAAPTSARFSFTARQLDWGWLVIRSFRKLGWLQVRHAGIHLTAAAQQGLSPGQFHPGPQPEPELV
jgi:stearoyl-CoA desaturase (Delta-9 desaturase)